LASLLEEILTFDNLKIAPLTPLNRHKNQYTENRQNKARALQASGR
jgi:hypothetical protein